MSCSRALEFALDSKKNLRVAVDVAYSTIFIAFSQLSDISIFNRTLNPGNAV